MVYQPLGTNGADFCQSAVDHNVSGDAVKLQDRTLGTDGGYFTPPLKIRLDDPLDAVCGSQDPLTL